jgi:ABC-type phosphate transport system substrate-binding protein
MRRIGTILCAAALLIASARATPAEPALVVIVNRHRPAALSLAEVSNIYLKKRRFWDDGTPIVPLNREPGSGAREDFSRRILGAPSGAFAAYWNQQYFHGVFPPVALSSGAAVKRYVAAERDAIGYVDASEVDDSVRVVLRLR